MTTPFTPCNPCPYNGTCDEWKRCFHPQAITIRGPAAETDRAIIKAEMERRDASLAARDAAAIARALLAAKARWQDLAIDAGLLALLALGALTALGWAWTALRHVLILTGAL